jgi:hypothetical protein
MENRVQGSETGLVAYITFDDGTAVDVSGNGHDGTLLGGAELVIEDGPTIETLGTAFGVSLLNGNPNHLFQLEGTTNLITSIWTDIGDPEPGGNNPKVFYRPTERPYEMFRIYRK